MYFEKNMRMASLFIDGGRDFNNVVLEYSGIKKEIPMGQVNKHVQVCPSLRSLFPQKGEERLGD